MIQAIGPISAETRLAQLLGDDQLMAQAPVTAPDAATPLAQAPAAAGKIGLSGNAFEDVLNKTIEALNGVSRSEMYANQLIDKYAKGQAELQDVMVAQAKMSVMTTLAVTTVNTAVNTFKEITQIQM